MTEPCVEDTDGNIQMAVDNRQTYGSRQTLEDRWRQTDRLMSDSRQRQTDDSAQRT